MPRTTIRTIAGPLVLAIALIAALPTSFLRAAPALQERGDGGEAPAADEARKAAGIAPVATINFDPLGRDVETALANVFVAKEIPWEGGNRPWVIFANGGGFKRDTGAPLKFLPMTQTALLWLLYRAGWVVISTGYTVHDPDIDGEGLFHPEDWASDPVTGELRLDPDKLERRSAEHDIVHLVQYLRHVGVPEVPDLDRRPGRGGICASSSGCIALNFVVLGPERAALQAEDPRYTTSTRLGFGVGERYLCSFAAFDTKVVSNHHPTKTGRRAQRLGGATLRSIDETSALCYTFRHASTRQLAASVPVYLSSSGAVVHPGPYDYASLRRVFGDYHPPENVLAMQDGLLAAGEEFADATHRDHSVFVIETLDDESNVEWMQRRFAWIQATHARQERRRTASGD